MRKKIMMIGAVLLLSVSVTACAGKMAANTELSVYDDAAELLAEVKTTQNFTGEKVSDENIKKILSAGINAPSAMNTQPWHFTAITDEEVTQKIADAMSSLKPPSVKDSDADKSSAPADSQPDQSQPQPSGASENAGNLPDDKPNFSKSANKAGIGDAPLTIIISCENGSELSAGLAVQNMSAEAQLLGYGTKILTSPTLALNGENQDEYKAFLNIPDTQKAAADLIVGKAAADDDNPDAVSSATKRNDFADVVTIIEE